MYHVTLNTIKNIKICNHCRDLVPNQSRKNTFMLRIYDDQTMSLIGIILKFLGTSLLNKSGTKINDYLNKNPGVYCIFAYLTLLKGQGGCEI